MPKLPQDIAERIMSRDFEQEERDADAQEREHRKTVLAVHASARYATVERKRFLRAPQWFVVDGTGWERGPYTRAHAESYRESLARMQMMIVRGGRA